MLNYQLSQLPNLSIVPICENVNWGANVVRFQDLYLEGGAGF